MSRDFATADLLDESPQLQCCLLALRQFGGRTRFAGRVRTVRCLEDNVLLRQMLSEPGHGQVAVVDGSGSLRTALMGDLLARSAFENGWEGIIINGAVRDVVELAAVDVGIKALGSSPRRSGKAGEGQVDVPVSFGDAVFAPGAEVYSDEDGVVVTQLGLAPASGAP